MGHETMGEVVEVGSRVKRIKVGDKIVIPFDIACGSCSHCKEEEYSFCDNTNPNAVLADTMYGHGGSALFGYSHIYGGYAGGQAEFIRVPFVDTNSLVIPQGIEDEKVLFLSDIFPTGYMAAENANIKRGDTVAVWGAGPVGQMVIKSAFLLGAERVIAIDHYNKRLDLARASGAETINFDEVEGILDEVAYLTGGRGPDSCIDAVGLEAHGHGVTAALDYAKAGIGPRNRSTRCSPPSDSSLQQRRNRFCTRSLRRTSRQISVRRCLRKRPHVQNGPNPHAEVHAAASRTHHERRDRPILRHQRPRSHRRRTHRLQDVRIEKRRMHEGRHQNALNLIGRGVALRPYLLRTISESGKFRYRLLISDRCRQRSD